MSWHYKIDCLSHTQLQPHFWIRARRLWPGLAMILQVNFTLRVVIIITIPIGYFTGCTAGASMLHLLARPALAVTNRRQNSRFGARMDRRSSLAPRPYRYSRKVTPEVNCRCFSSGLH
jgi:hypothetical protein